ncbi:hypothetical protein IFM89_013766 [Coptis chinensis]|uniref:Uncharacterized protein n=1 Tax=Coptis chinensis TaxID=261450 RepID=A0A835LZF4_9MAGN|nr:hypothetical protein IFM89_013766 [Coptis chinensis]
MKLKMGGGHESNSNCIPITRIVHAYCVAKRHINSLMPLDARCKKEKSEPKKLVFEEEAKESSSSKSNSNLELNIELVIEDLSEAFIAKILLKGKEHMKQI